MHAPFFLVNSWLQPSQNDQISIFINGTFIIWLVGIKYIFSVNFSQLALKMWIWGRKNIKKSLNREYLSSRFSETGEHQKANVSFIFQYFSTKHWEHWEHVTNLISLISIAQIRRKNFSFVRGMPNYGQICKNSIFSWTLQSSHNGQISIFIDGSFIIWLVGLKYIFSINFSQLALKMWIWGRKNLQKSLNRE